MDYKETKFVVEPLKRWFPSNWKVYSTKHSSGEKGWDLVATRHNLELFIEAKWFSRKSKFAALFVSLIGAPTTNRQNPHMSRKTRSWSNRLCWAIGTDYDSDHFFQLLFDYLSRNPEFYGGYGDYSRMKYVYFVNKNKVHRVLWEQLLACSKRYLEEVKKQDLPSPDSIEGSKQRRPIAEKIAKSFAPSFF